MKRYMKDIWRTRYFWWNLAMSDLRAKWRRSYLGILWSILQPLGMTVLISIVFSKVFHADIITYLPYILSGLIVWDFIASSLTNGALAYVQADAYIKQCKTPLAIYTLRTVITQLVIMLLSSSVLIVLSAVLLPQNIGWSWLSILFFYPIIALISWPLITILAYLGVQYRDIPHAMGLVLQIFWFASPVYFEAKLFIAGGLPGLVYYNPLYHLLQLVRRPLLEGHLPSFTNYAFVFGLFIVASVIAMFIGYRMERRVIFYL